MSFLKSIDTGLFNFLNQSISNPVFDWLMPFLSGNNKEDSMQAGR